MKTIEKSDIDPIGFSKPWVSTPIIDYKLIDMTNINQLAEEIAYNENKKSIWEIVWWLVKQGPSVIKLIYYVIKIKDTYMTDPKTTIMSIVQVIVLVLTVLGIKIDPEQSTLFVTAGVSLYSLVILIKGWFTKDATPPKTVK